MFDGGDRGNVRITVAAAPLTAGRRCGSL